MTLLLLGILSVGSGLGQVLDQEFDPEKSSAPVGVALGIGDQSDKAMTFTAGTTGTLHSVEVYVARVDTVTQPLLVDVRRTSGGVPNEDDKAVLGSVSLPASSIATTQSFIGVDLSTFGAKVSAGEVLAIVLRTTLQAPIGLNYYWHGKADSQIDQYTGGETYLRNANFPQWTALDSVSTGLIRDVGFRTYLGGAAPDKDKDGVPDSSDNCPDVPNPNQVDTDQDGVGDACETELFSLTLLPSHPTVNDEVTVTGEYSERVQNLYIGLYLNRQLVKECEVAVCRYTSGPFPNGLAYYAVFRDGQGVLQETDEEYAVWKGQDWDFDGIDNSDDNCLLVPNSEQEDTDSGCYIEDGNLICEPDGWGDACDNCPDNYNPHQLNHDDDSMGDICDDDDDNDGCLDDLDSAPFVPSIDDEFACRESPLECGNFGDGIGADCDNCPDYYNPLQEDADDDGIGDDCDNCSEFANPDQADLNFDGIGDGCDPDWDNDGCPNASDLNPWMWSSDDLDADGFGTDCDNCPGIPNAFQSDGDGDGVGTACDNCPFDSNRYQTDSDRDAIGNQCDNCRDYPNPSQADSDGDGIGDVCDCGDGIQGEFEHGIDCGGPCPMCRQCGSGPIPRSFDWRDYLTFPPIRDQSSCGSCWAFAAAGAAEGSSLLNHGVALDLAEEQLVSFCGSVQSCNGGWAHDALRYTRDLGLVDETCYPYSSGSCLYDADLDGDGVNDIDGACCDSDAVSEGWCPTACDCTVIFIPTCAADCECSLCADGDEKLWKIGWFDDVSNDPDEIKRALMCHGPLSVASSTWHHAIGLVGFDDDLALSYDTDDDGVDDDFFTGVWIIRNSWGTGYQEGGQGPGYGAIPYSGHEYSDIRNNVHYVGGVGKAFPIDFARGDGLAAGDVNGDGADEIVRADLDDRIQVFDRHGTIVSTFTLVFDDGDKIGVGDVDGDRVAEIVHADRTNWIRIYSMSGSLLNEFMLSFDSGDKLAVADVTGDGAADILHGDITADSVLIYTNTGTLLGEIEFDRYPLDSDDSLAAADIDRDLKAEILHGDAGRNEVHVYEPDGYLGRTFGFDLAGNDGFAASDLDGDGKVEFICGDRDDWIRIEDKSGTLLREYRFDFESGDRLTVGDTDGDGRKEIIHGDRGDWVMILHY